MLSGDDVLCGGCGEVVYPGPGPFVIANHDLTRLRDGRVHWWSRDFEITVHICRTPESEAAVSATMPLADRMLDA